MAGVIILWDLEDDSEGNYWHIVVEGHGIIREEVEEVLRNPDNLIERSRSSDNLITFGETSLGQYIAVAFTEVLDDPRTLYPVTAYPTNRPGKPKKKGKRKQ